jgi:hypothetical protein
LEIIVYRDLYRRIERAEKLLDQLVPAPLNRQQARERRMHLFYRKIDRVRPATPEELAELAELNERLFEENVMIERSRTLRLRDFSRNPPLNDKERQELAELNNKLEAMSRSEDPL